MKLGLTMIAVVLGVAAAATTAHACGYHGAMPSAATQASGSQMTTTATTTTGKTTGG